MSASSMSGTFGAPGRPPTPSGRLMSIVAVAFGLMTILGGAGVLVEGDTARRVAGDHVPFVIGFNFLAGFLYVAAGIGIWTRAGWSVVVSIGIVVGTADVLLALVVYALAGGSYEIRTMVAMALRTGVWLALALGAHRCLHRGGAGRSGAAGPSLHASRERGRP